jgi:extradiol dioxygenase
MNDGTVSPHSLAYAGIETPEADAWRNVGPGVFGFEVRTDAPDGAVMLRVDERHHRLVARRGERNRLAYLGWEVADAAALDAIADRIEAAGLSIVRDDPALRDARHFERVATFTDPFGQQHEIAVGPRDESPFTPGRAIEGRFITGDGGFGHAVLIVPDLESATAFYVDVLGLALSDTISENGLNVRFFHTNPRHHSLAFVAIPGMRGLHHFMFEVSQLDDVGHAFYLLPEFDLPVAMSLGRHPNDRMFSFYARVPGGFEIEYGYGGLRIRNDRPWEVQHFEQLSEWGHKPNPALGPPLTLEPVAGFAPPPPPLPDVRKSPAANGTPPSVSGTWSTVTKTPMGDQPGSVDLTEGNGTLTGTLAGRDGLPVAIYDGAFDGTTLTWKADVTQPFTMTLEFTASIDGDAMSGSVKAGNFGTSPFAGQRAGVASV